MHLRKVFAGCAVIVLLGGGIRALEIEILGGAGNMAFDNSSEQALVSGGKAYTPQVFPLGHISIKSNYSEFLDFSFRVEQAPLLRVRALGAIGLNFNFGRFEIGPMIGLFNTEEQPLTGGISGGFRLEYPGIIFGSLKGASTLASPLSIPGDYIQSEGEAVLGFWVPNVICAASIGIKNFTLYMSEAVLSRDEQIRYQFSADVFSKNVPYTVRVDMGYEELKRSYRISSGIETDELKSVYLGFEGTWRIIPSLRVILGLEAPLHSWTGPPLKKADSQAVLFRGQAGIIWTF
jgi:hypothetical protein